MNGENNPEMSRSTLLQSLEAARRRHAQQPDHAPQRLELARLLMQAGEFWEADQTVAPLLATNAESACLSLAANLSYLLGRYAQAEELLLALLAQQGGNTAARLKAEMQLLFTYYQTGQFAQARGLLQGQDENARSPYWRQMAAFGDEPPYQPRWEGRDEVHVPFNLTDPLPILRLEIQGRAIYALIDTGGDNLYLDNQYAAELGIEPVAEVVAQFGGGMEGRIGFARGRNLRLGEVTLNTVPITILPTQRWSKGFADGRYTIGGVIGTGILKQFLATIDYPAGQLILRPRRPETRRTFLQATRRQPLTAIPFAMWQTHHMLARGSLNGFSGLTFFIDSGLSSPDAFVAPVQTLEYTGIPIPRTAIDENSIGGGGEGLWASGSFPIGQLTLGPLVKENVTGNYGALTPETYWQKGLIQDGLISHQFLRDYRWTLDFDAMTYYFERP